MARDRAEAPPPYTSPSFERAAQPHLMNIMNVRLMRGGLSPFGEDLANWGDHVHAVKISPTGFELQFSFGYTRPRLNFEQNGEKFSLSIAATPFESPNVVVQWNKDKPPAAFCIQKLLDKNRRGYLLVYGEETGLVVLDTDGNVKEIPGEDRDQIPGFLSALLRVTS